MSTRGAAVLMGELLRAAVKVGSLWKVKQAIAAPSRYYGNGGTIHANSDLDVEVHEGRVVAVWYRCQALPFEQHEVGPWRADEMRSHQAVLPRLTGVEVMDVAP